MIDDADLLAGARKGDETAFRALYERHASSILTFAWLLTRSKPEAEEVVQETFVVLIRKSGAYDPCKAQLRTWLFGVARNLSFQKRQREQRNHELIAVVPEAPTESSESVLIREETAETVRNAVSALPDAQREAVFLFEFEGLSLNETAAILRIEPNAVKARLHRGRESLKRALAELNPVKSAERRNPERGTQ